MLLVLGLVLILDLGSRFSFTSFYSYIHPSIELSIQPFIHLSIYLTIYSFIQLFIYNIDSIYKYIILLSIHSSIFLQQQQKKQKYTSKYTLNSQIVYSIENIFSVELYVHVLLLWLLFT